METELVLIMLRLAFMAGWIENSVHDAPERADLPVLADEYAVEVLRAVVAREAVAA